MAKRVFEQSLTHEEVVQLIKEVVNAKEDREGCSLGYLTAGLKARGVVSISPEEIGKALTQAVHDGYIQIRALYPEGTGKVPEVYFVATS